MKLDFCVALSGPLIVELWRLFWARLNYWSDLNGVILHLINKDGAPHTITSILETVGIEHHVYNLPFIKGDHPQLGNNDVDRTCHYMVEHCGNNDWLCISHFDIVFYDDWLGQARSLIRDRVGMIGHHCPIMLLRREAYKDSASGFKMGEGYDTGRLLEKELIESGWLVESFEDAQLEESHWFHHIGFGGTHYDAPNVEAKRSLIAQLSRENMQPQQTTIHLHTPGQNNGVACGSFMPQHVASLKHHNHQFSGEPRAVNCPNCKNSKAYKEAVEKLRASGVQV